VRLLVAHLVDQDGRYFLPGVAQQHGPIADVGDVTAEHLAALLVHLNLADPGRASHCLLVPRRLPPLACCHTRLTRLALLSLLGDGRSVAVDPFKIKKHPLLVGAFRFPLARLKTEMSDVVSIRSIDLFHPIIPPVGNTINILFESYPKRTDCNRLHKNVSDF
jgi:hypothetical protein